MSKIKGLLPYTPYTSTHPPYMPKRLSPTQQEIFDYLENGATPEEIQRSLKMTPNCYRVHCYNIRQKLGREALPGTSYHTLTDKEPTSAQWDALYAVYVQKLTVEQFARESSLKLQTIYNHLSKGRKALGLPRGASARDIRAAMGYGPEKRENPMDDPMF